MVQRNSAGQTRAPKFSIEATSVVDANNINVRLRTAKNAVPESLEVLVYVNNLATGRFTTNSAGFYNYALPYTEKAKKQTISIEFYLETSTEKATIMVEIPELPAAPTNDPSKIILIRTSDTLGNFRVLIRVLREGGYGLSTDVNLIFENNRYLVHTDNAGLYTFCIPRLIAPGENLPLQAIVNGIEDAASIRISRRTLRVPSPTRMSAQWLLGTNNGRAFILMCLATFFWIFALVIGIGKPIFHENIFRGENGLSTQEMTYNRVMTQVYADKAITFAPNEVSGQWHHVIWKIAIILTLILLVYGPLSLREEIAEEISRAVENMRDREYAQAGDPWFEKLVAWTGSYAVARNRNLAVSATASSQTTEASTDKKSGWGNFPMLLASDAIVEIVPAIVRAMFHR